MTTPALTAGLQTERFLAKVVFDPNTGCSLWSGGVNSRGYPCVAIGGKSYLAHRVAFVTWKGPIPEGHQVDHVCEVKLCVGPDHLEAVTGKENVRRFNRGYHKPVPNPVAAAEFAAAVFRSRDATVARLLAKQADAPS